MKTAWKYWGRLDSKKAVFATQDGDIAVEEDHRHLIEATPEQKQEIYKTWPDLVDKVVELKGRFPKIKPDVIGELKDKIIALEFEAAESRNLIAALKDANTAKDEMIVSLMQDIAELEGRILGAHETNRRWKEEVVRRDGTIEALMSQIKEGGYAKKAIGG